jgi:hypothetical protein
LIDAITTHIDQRNAEPTPLVWAITVTQILKSVG